MEGGVWEKKIIIFIFISRGAGRERCSIGAKGKGEMRKRGGEGERGKGGLVKWSGRWGRGKKDGERESERGGEDERERDRRDRKGEGGWEGGSIVGGWWRNLETVERQS